MTSQFANFRRTAALVASACTSLALGACTAASAPIGPPTTTAVTSGALEAGGLTSRLDPGWLAPEARTKNASLVYVSAPPVVNIYTADRAHKLVGTISYGLEQPEGLFVDATGDLFVVDNHAVFEFPPGSTMPSATYTDQLTAPRDVAVGQDGTVYVDDLQGGPSDGQIVEYRHGKTKPFRIIPVSIYPEGVTLDSQDNLYVTYFRTESGPSDVKMYPKGSRNGEELGLLGLQNAFGIVVDGAGNLVVADSFGSAIDIFPPESRTPTRSINVQGPFFIALDKSEKLLYVAAGTDDLIYDYATGTLVGTIGNCSSDCGGVALSPSAQGAAEQRPH